MKSRSLVFVAIATLVGAGALSCASQSAATPTPEQREAVATAAEKTAADTAASQQDSATSAPATPAPVAGDMAPAVVGPQQVAWKDMTKEQRAKYMGAVVLPKMREVFRAFDGEKFAAIGCGTCHGKEARTRGFKMPNPEIMALPSSDEDWGKLMKEKPELLKFMGEKVKPEMAALLGMKPYDPQNPQPQPEALGCSTCHTKKGQ